MTTKTDDIKLPPLPVAVPWHKGYDRESLESYARAAVEANQRGQGNTLDMDVVAEKLRGMAASGYETAMAFGVSQDSFERLARQVFDYALLLRYGSSQPAISDEQFQCVLQVYDDALDKARDGREFANPGRPGSLEARAWDAGTQRGKDLGPISQPAASAEPSGYAYRYPDGIRFNDGREVNGCKPTETLPYWFGAAPVAQEPVAYLACDPETGEPVWGEDCVCKDNVYSPEDTGTIGRPVVFAAPVAAQAQPWQALAAAMYQAAGAYDMPVRILDALSAAANGEQFAHLIDGLLPVECPKISAQDREDAKRYTWLRDHPPKDCQGGMRVRIWGESGDWTSISGEKLDVAIDAARAAKGADHD